jgi:serine/threonine protein kinase
MSPPATPPGSSTPPPDTRDRLTERVRRLTLGRFDILRLLGRGGMAAVYLAYDLRLARKVALKVMLPQVELAEGMSDRFLQEAKTSARLAHPNIVMVHSVEEFDELVFFIMNLIEGATLEHVLLSLRPTVSLMARQLPVLAAQSVILQVAAALEYAHGERVVHRDIKPSNVMITARGDAVVTDFGIAKVMADVSHTKSSMLMGTPIYMSPEQCRGAPVTGASDQYSLGVMAYEALVGAPPFMGTMLAVVNAHVEREPQPILDRRPEIPATFAAAIMRMLAKRPEDRFASMTSVIEAIGVGFNALDGAPRQFLGAAASTTPDSATIAFQTPLSPIFRREQTVEPQQVDLDLDVGQRAQLDIEHGEHATHSDKHTPVAWRARDPSIVRVGADGEVEALTPGETTISGMVGDQPVVCRVTVHPITPAPVASIDVPASIEVANAEEVMLSASAKDAGGNALSDRAIVFSTAAPDILNIDANGRIVAMREGVAVVRASSEAAFADVSVSVTPARVASMKIEPAHITVIAGHSFELAATPLDRLGRPISGRVVEWRTSPANIVLPEQAGRFSALTPGEVTVSALCGSRSVTAVAEIVAAPAKVAPAPNAAVSREPRRRKRITPRDLGVVPQQPPVQPSRRRNVLAVAGGVVFLVVAGVAAAIWLRGSGPAASSEPSALIGDSAPPPNVGQEAKPADLAAIEGIDLNSSPTQVLIGDSALMRVRLIGPGGKQLASSGVTWTSTDPARMSVNSRGVVTALQPGETQITASVGGKSASVFVVGVTTLTAESDSLRADAGRQESGALIATRVDLAVSTGELQVGGEGQFSVRALSASELEVANVSIQVTADPPGVLRIDEAAGTFTALRTGRVTITASAGSMSDAESIVVGGASESAQPVRTPPARSSAASPTTAPVPSVADLNRALEPFVTALKSGKQDRIALFFRQRSPSHKALDDWVATTHNLAVLPVLPVRQLDGNTLNPFLEIRIPVEWKTWLGKCKTGVLVVKGWIELGKPLFELTTPPTGSDIPHC